jgi:hypothetical protein
MGYSNRRWKPQRRNDFSGNDEILLIWEGIDRHIKADAHFHNSTFFKENTQSIRKILENHGLQDKGARLFFLAHIGLELLLDRLILKSYPGIADRFYSDLFALEHKTIQSALESGVNPDYGRFFEMFARFKEARYLYTYLEDDRLLFALNRIMGRASQPAMHEDYQEKLKLAFLEAEALLSGVYLEFFEEMATPAP